MGVAAVAGAIAFQETLKTRGSGNLLQMETVAAVTPALSGDAARRFDAAIAKLTLPQAFDIARAEALVGEVLVETA